MWNIFLDASGSTGKIFVPTLLMVGLRSQKRIALAVASLGIASALLPADRTAHSTFKLPLDLNRNSGIAQVSKRCYLIVLDKFPMKHKRAFESLDRKISDIRINNSLMGELPVFIFENLNKFSLSFQKVLEQIKFELH